MQNTQSSSKKGEGVVIIWGIPGCLKGRWVSCLSVSCLSLPPPYSLPFYFPFLILSLSPLLSLTLSHSLLCLPVVKMTYFKKSHPLLEMWYLLLYWITRTNLQSSDPPQKGSISPSEKSWSSDHTGTWSKQWESTGIWQNLGIFMASLWCPYVTNPLWTHLSSRMTVVGSRSPLQKSVYPWVARQGARVDTYYNFIDICQIPSATRGFYLDKAPKLALQNIIPYGLSHLL